MDILDLINKEKSSDYILSLYHNGELQKILPELVALNIKEDGHKNNFYHTLKVIDNIEKDKLNINIKLIGLLHDIGKAITKKYTTKWTFHNHEKVGADMAINILNRFNITEPEFLDYVYRMIENHGRLKIHTDVTDSAIRRLDLEVGKDIIFDLIDFCKCDLTSSKPERVLYIKNNLDLIKQRIIEVRKMDEEAKWRSPLTGDMIMSILNLPPCKLVGDIKKEYDERFKNNSITLEVAIEELKKRS